MLILPFVFELVEALQHRILAKVHRTRVQSYQSISNDIVIYSRLRQTI